MIRTLMAHVTFAFAIASTASNLDNVAGAVDGGIDEVRVMSFNIRYGTADDGVNRWERRKEFLVETIRAFSPDLLGTQETFKFQRDYLAEQLPEYDWVGVGREDGRDGGEMTAIYYRKDRFDKLGEGHFWLSETPDIPGSKSWDSSLPRMVSWVRLVDKSRENAPPIFFANTHFDHRGAEARLESARLVRRYIARHAGDAAVVLTGDFNAGEASESYRALFASETEQLTLKDCFRTAHPTRQENEGTFSGFEAVNIGGERIDWIACSAEWTIRSCEIDRTDREGRTPSDHFPVTAILSQ